MAALNMRYLIGSSLPHPLKVGSVVPILQIMNLRLREVSSKTERELGGRIATDTEHRKEGDQEMKTRDRHELGSRGHSFSSPLPSSQPLPWVSGASGATSLAKGFPGRSEMLPSPLQPSRLCVITASLQNRMIPSLSPWIQEDKPWPRDTQQAGPCMSAKI